MKHLITVLLISLTPQVFGQFVISSGQDVADGAGSFSSVGPGDTVYIESGSRGKLIIKNFTGTTEKPILFVPSDPQEDVIIRSNYTYGISIRQCNHVRLSGLRPYGIRILEVGETDNTVGISMEDKSSSVEIDHMEIAHTGFAGIMAKTNPVCEDPTTHRGAFIQYDTRIHHCHIHDTHGEGMYIGNTYYNGYEADCGTLYPSVLIGVEVHHNLIERTGYDGIQVSSAISGCHIYNNVLNDVSYRQARAQRSGILIGGGTLAECYNNRITDCQATGILVFGQGGTRVYNNLIIRPGLSFEPDNPDQREHGIFIENKTHDVNSWYGIFSNTIIRPKSDAIRISNNHDFEVRLFNNLLVDPGAREVYENDNTDRTAIDAFIFQGSTQTPVVASHNAFLTHLDHVQFTDAATDNYHLQPDAAEVDGGRDLSDQTGINFDLDGNPRPLLHGWDIGAYEYNTLSVAALFQTGVASPVSAVFYSPDRGSLMINLTEQAELSYRLWNLNGQLISAGRAGERPVGLSELTPVSRQPGIMICQVFSQNWQFSEKVLLN